MECNKVSLFSFDPSLQHDPAELRIWPNALTRSALFGLTNGRRRRRYIRHQIATVDVITIVYTGEELCREDERVYLELCRLTQRLREDGGNHFTANQILDPLGIPPTAANYRRLEAVLDRLLRAQFRLSANGRDEACADTFYCHRGLFSGFEGRLSGLRHGDELRVSLDDVTSVIFGTDDYTRLKFDQWQLMTESWVGYNRQSLEYPKWVPPETPWSSARCR